MASKFDRSRMFELWLSGYSQAEIARAVGCSRERIRQLVARGDFPEREAIRRATKWSFNPSVFRSEVAARGLTMRELARISGVHEVSLYNYCRGHSSPSPRSLTRLAMTLARIPRLPVDLFAELPPTQSG